MSDIPQLDISHIARSAEVARKFLLRQVVKDERHRAANRLREWVRVVSMFGETDVATLLGDVKALANEIENGE